MGEKTKHRNNDNNMLADVYLVDLESLPVCVWCQLGKLLPGPVLFVVCVFKQK